MLSSATSTTGLLVLGVAASVALALPGGLQASSQQVGAHTWQGHPQGLTTTLSPEAAFLGLAASADEQLHFEKIDVEFSCATRKYGYYADPANKCRVYHVCHPVRLADGTPLTMQYSFYCPKNTAFSQTLLTCVVEPLPEPCEASPSYYSINSRFGLPGVPAGLQSGAPTSAAYTVEQPHGQQEVHQPHGRVSQLHPIQAAEHHHQQQQQHQSSQAGMPPFEHSLEKEDEPAFPLSAPTQHPAETVVPHPAPAGAARTPTETVAHGPEARVIRIG